MRSRSQPNVVRLQGNNIFCCYDHSGYTYILYLYVSMCKYIYICSVDMFISPCVSLQLFENWVLCNQVLMLFSVPGQKVRAGCEVNN